MTTGARLLVLWDAPRDAEEFHRHYREVHIPLAKRNPGLRRYTLSGAMTRTRGGEPYYYAIAELDFDDMSALQAALRSPEGRATAADADVLAAGAAIRSMMYELEDL